MKPYFKLLYNKVRLLGIRLFQCPNLTVNGFQLFGFNTKMVFNRTGEVCFNGRIISDGRCVLIVDKGAVLKIGSGVYFNEGMMISCKSKVEIGDGCQFGPNVKIFDNNHRYNSKQGVLPEHSCGNIQIGNNCWIAANVTILKNTKIGDNCVIGAGCVVSGVIPDGSVVTQSRKLEIRPIQETK
ncbi:MAG: acyltransferase [Acutalibacteraceae bacterium]